MRLRYNLLSVIIIVFGLNGIVCAQQVWDIKGVVFKKSSSERISQALVTDLNSKVLMMTDELGGFSIKAVIGDTLVITKNNFTPQRMVITNKDDIAVFLQPVIELEQVTIKDQSKKQELKEVMQQYRSEGIFNDGKSLPAWAFINSPLTGLYNLFGKEPAEARRFAAFSKNELEANEVSRRYTKDLVKSVTKLPDDEIPKFMNTFTPSYEDLKEWNDYQLITYIKKSLSYYQKHKKQASNLQKLY
jgi:hypothetical protein